MVAWPKGLALSVEGKVLPRISDFRQFGTFQAGLRGPQFYLFILPCICALCVCYFG